MNTSQFNKCVDKYSDGLYRFVLGIVHDSENARDVMQESFARFWEHRRDVENGKEKSYLFTIAYNLAISMYRVGKRRIKESIEEYSTKLMDNSNVYDDRTEILWRELDRLAPISRSLIMLCDWEGYSYNEIAQITNLNEGQVKVGLHRARLKIKQRFETYYDEK